MSVLSACRFQKGQLSRGKQGGQGHLGAVSAEPEVDVPLELIGLLFLECPQHNICVAIEKVSVLVHRPRFDLKLLYPPNTDPNLEVAWNQSAEYKQALLHEGCTLFHK